MGMNMAGNLKKNGFDVKGFDISEATRERAKKDFVSLILDSSCALGCDPSCYHRRGLEGR